MSLQAKIIGLKLEAALAVKHANGWQRLIDLYGEDKATAFYTHLGLNHLETKSYEWEGLKLSREPRQSELIAIKGVHQAQESNKERLTTLLLKLRSTMIADALAQLSDLNPADYHTLTVSIPATERNKVKEALLDVFNEGRSLVRRELIRGKADNSEDESNDFDELDVLSDVTAARIANDTQARIIGAASRLTVLNVTGNALTASVRSEINSGSTAYIDRAATGLTNRTLNLGRSEEAAERSDEWDKVEYSAILDTNVCGPCSSVDGETATDEDDLQPAPNPECEGLDNCRCFWIYVTV